MTASSPSSATTASSTETASATGAAGTASVSTGTPRTARPVVPTAGARTVLDPLVGTGTRISDGFWSVRQQRNGADAVRSGYHRLEEAGNLANLRIAAGLETGEATGPVFMDSDVYKWLEAVAWEHGRNPSDDLLALQREVTGLVAAAQQDDGYLDSVVQLWGAGKPDGGRYADLPWSHEHYCAGHLFQAAVAQKRATGDTALLDVAVKLADHLDATFGDAKRHDVDGHPVVEMGLVELYRETGERRYLDLARYFVDARGHGLMEGYGKEPTYFSDRVPVREATTVEGHAVRAVYLAAGAADVAVELGDAELLAASRTQFASMMASKAFITGGLGARWDYEAFGDPYELPADRGYAETCAAIGGVQWAWRLLLATGEAQYADAVERLLYNAFLPGVSLAGSEYFYVNPLQLRDRAHTDENRSPAHGRRAWFDCACCPPNIMRMFASLDAYLATSSAEGLQVHQYASGDLAFDGDGAGTGTGGAAGSGRVHVETSDPVDGEVTLTVEEARGTWSLDLRLPGWSDVSTLELNGEAVAVDTAPGGYARITREWQVGDVVVLTLDTTPHLWLADDRIDGSRGQVAVERGPLVYAVEHVDNADLAVDDLEIDPGALVTERHEPGLFDGVVTLGLSGTVPATAHDDAAWPYRRVDRPGDTEAARATEATGDTEAARASVAVTAIPYFAWANREVGPMRVWLPTAR